jgi:Flp pilus assembly protein TadD
MEAVARAPARLIGIYGLRVDPAGFAVWLIAALLIVYLALNNGGYGVIERSEVGIVVWWVVLVGTLAGALPAAGGTRTGRLILVVLAAFAGWTALSLGWSESSERTATELARVAVYLGVFVLALAIQGQGRWRHMLHGVTVGIAIVAGLAVLSRFEPTWFPDRVTGEYLPGIQIERRLAYPLNYSTGLAALGAIGLPLLLAATATARTVPAQALAAGAIPVVALALWLTTSGLFVPVAAGALLVFFALAPDRIPKLVTLLTAGGGSAILFAAVEQRDALDRGLPTAAAQKQGDEMIAIVLVVCAGVALVQAGLGLVVRYGRRPGWLHVPRERALAAMLVALPILAAIAVAGGVPGELSDRWETFKGREGEPVSESRGEQLLSVSGSGRYQFWQAATDANETEPVLGIGPGTFEFWWSRNGLYSGFVRDAHSLYVETLGELGIIGLILIAAFLLGVVGVGAVRALRAPPQLRVGLAGATAACAGFAAAAGVDWVWELSTIPVAFMALAAVAVAGGATESARRRRRPPSRSSRIATSWRRYRAQAGISVLSIAALLIIAIPLAADTELRESRSAVARGDLEGALASADTAADLQPYAAAPRLQQALVLELRGDFDAAARAARRATEKESTNWRTWLIRSRLEARAGRAEASARSYRKADALSRTTARTLTP